MPQVDSNGNFSWIYASAFCFHLCVVIEGYAKQSTSFKHCCQRKGITRHSARMTCFSSEAPKSDSASRSPRCDSEASRLRTPHR